MKKISIIIPCYNESKTIGKILKKILNQNYIKKQIIIVDDNSSDNSLEIIKKYSKNINKIILHKNNKGKGACIISAKKYIKGSAVIIQDGDLEYDPRDYKKLLNPIFNKQYKVVYGSRVLGKKLKKIKKSFDLPNLRVFGNFILTKISNLINNQNLTDAHTCYKVFESNVFKSLKLKEKDFAFCPEVTSLISKKKIKIFEVPISYKGRSVANGKKIKFNDAVRAVQVLFKTNFLR